MLIIRCINAQKIMLLCSMMASLAISLAINSTAHAAQASRGFNVTVNYQTSVPPLVPTSVAGPNSAFCRVSNDPNAFGATYTIVCATGAVVDIEPGRTGMPFTPIHGGAYRYLFQANRGGNMLGTIDSYIGAGTVTSWRTVNLTDRDYLEMLVNW